MSNLALGPLVFDIEGGVLTAEDKQILLSPYVGGLILFSRNFSCENQLQDLIDSIRAVRPNIFIGVDQEGGRVQRFREGFTRLPSLQMLARAAIKQPETDFVSHCAWVMASELLSVGIDASFAPVVDADESFSEVIGDRSFSNNEDVVVELATKYISAMNSAGMKATLKHFPGHGAVKADSHVDVPVDERGFDEIFDSDMRPFRQLAKQADALMPAHILFPAVDASTVGFSKVWLRGVLREQLGFDGVIFSDDLSMVGAGSVGGYANRVQAALGAGCDAALVCNSRQGVLESLSYLESSKAVVTDRIAAMRAKGSIFGIGLKALQSGDRWRTSKSVVEEVFNLGH